MPAVSVIIPYYNRVSWLARAIQSVLEQTFDNFEVIVVDDGSTEPADAIREIKDRRIRIIRLNHQGAAAARNDGIERAQGKYIAFLDADDFFSPHKLQVQFAMMEVNPNASLSHTSYHRVDANGKYLGTIESGKFGGNIYPAIVIHCPIATPTVMVRRSALDGLKFEAGIREGEDIILWTQLARKSPVLGINEPLTSVRMHGQNSTINPFSQLRGQSNVLAYAVKHDKNLNYMFRLKAKSMTLSSVGHLLADQGRKFKAMQLFAASFFLWPFNMNTLREAYRTLPERLRALIRRCRDAFHLR